MQRNNELLFYKKTESLLLDVYPILINFPRGEKFALTQEIKQAFYCILRNAMLANNIKSRRRQYQEEADANLKLLLVLFSIAKKQRYLNKRRHSQIQMKVEELGRILGGWMRSTR